MPWHGYVTRVRGDRSGPIRAHGAPVRVRLLNGPFTPSPLFQTSRLRHFCKLSNQIIHRGLPDLLPICGLFFLKFREHICYIALSSKRQRNKHLLTPLPDWSVVIVDLSRNTDIPFFLSFFFCKPFTNHFVPLVLTLYLVSCQYLWTKHHKVPACNQTKTCFMVLSAGEECFLFSNTITEVTNPVGLHVFLRLPCDRLFSCLFFWVVVICFFAASATESSSQC